MARMLRFYTKTLMALCLLGAIPVDCGVTDQPACLSETCAQALMDSINEQYHNEKLPYGPHSFPLFTVFEPDFIGPEFLTRGFLLQRIASMREFDWQNFQNPLLKRQFEVLLRDLNYPVLTNRLVRGRSHMRLIDTIRYVCERGHQANRCNKSFNRVTKPDMVKSDDLALIEWNWAEWRNKMPNDTRRELRYFMLYYQNMSTPAMPPSAIWYQNHEDRNFIDELEYVIQTISPFYSQVHAHLRHALRLRYGNDVIPASGLIPHHLMEKAFYQSWKKDGVLLNPYPHKKLPNMQQELNSMGISSFEFVNASVQFFKSMGFDNITDDFMREHFTEFEPFIQDCKASVTTYPKLKMLYCPKNTYKTLLTSHGDIAKVQYEILKRDKPLGLSNEACPGFGNALSEAVILSASSPKHLQQRLGLLLDYKYDEELTLNFLYRMAIHALLSIPTYFVHEKLWLDIIDKKITPPEYNCRYWDLMATYMGVGRPSVQTNPEAYEMPHKFYAGVVDDIKSTKKLFGELLGYQIFRDICSQIGEFEPGNPDKLLVNCDFANHRQAGDLLKNLMSAGSTKPWRELLQTLGQGKALRGSAFLDYYAPLSAWITNYNANNNIQVGWNPVNTCQRFH